MPDEGSVATYRALSLGAGVQSSVLALLLSRGDERLVNAGYPKPDVAVFADTGWEPQYVYEHLDWLETQLSFEVVRVQSGNIRDNLYTAKTPTGYSFVDVPLYTRGAEGGAGTLRRQCTFNYKIKSIHREVRTRAGGKPKRPFPAGQHTEMWLGISADEYLRLKPSREYWVEHRFPLVDIRMTREECLAWFNEEYPGRVLPRSACVICPYRSDANWLELKQEEPESYEEAVRFDQWMRKTKRNPVRKVLESVPYLHRSRRPLATVVGLREHEELHDDDFFGEECEGHCGV